MMPNLGLVFVTGLLSGGITCLAVQGGLLATLIAGRAGEGRGKTAGMVDTAVFLGTKLIAYSILGIALGLLGSVLTLTPRAIGGLQLVASLYMLGVAGALLNVHPIFRYFIIQTPKFLGRFVRSQSKRSEWFAPGLLGAATIFIPCGTTQAMMAQAMATANPGGGLMVMATFVLGTIPLFLLLGAGVSVAGEMFKNNFGKIAAALVVVVALVNLNGSLVLLGSPVNASRAWKEVYCTVTFCPAGNNVVAGSATDELVIDINNEGYEVSNPVIKAGQKVKVKLVNTDGRGCQQAFTIPSLGISKVVRVGGSDEFEFTAPSKPGLLAFSCSMGMYSGELTVVN